MDPTTTDAVVDDPGAGTPPAQPEESPQPATAETPPEPTPNAEAPAEPSDTDENLEWLKAKGIDPASPEAVAKIAEMARNAEKRMHESTAKASELSKALTPEPGTEEDDSLVAQLAAKVQALELSGRVNTFFASNPEAKELEGAMTKLVTDDPNLGTLVNSGYLSIEQLAALAKGTDDTRESDLKQQGGKEALERVAQKQQAKANPGSATTSAMANNTVTKANFDEWYAGLSPAQRSLPENQAIVNSLLS